MAHARHQGETTQQAVNPRPLQSDAGQSNLTGVHPGSSPGGPLDIALAHKGGSAMHNHRRFLLPIVVILKIKIKIIRRR